MAHDRVDKASVYAKLGEKQQSKAEPALCGSSTPARQGAPCKSRERFAGVRSRSRLHTGGANPSGNDEPTVCAVN